MYLTEWPSIQARIQSCTNRYMTLTHCQITSVFAWSFHRTQSAPPGLCQPYPTHPTHPPYQVIGVTTIIAGVALLFASYDRLTQGLIQSLAAAAARDQEAARSRMERELLRSRHVFASMVSHECRSPASAIIGALDLLRALIPAERAAEHSLLDMVSGGASQILGLVRAVPRREDAAPKNEERRR